MKAQWRRSPKNYVIDGRTIMITKKLYQLLPKLGEDEITAIYLRFWRCYSIAEVAGYMNWSWEKAYLTIEGAISELRKGFGLNGLRLDKCA